MPKRPPPERLVFGERYRVIPVVHYRQPAFLAQRLHFGFLWIATPTTFLDNGPDYFYAGTEAQAWEMLTYWVEHHERERAHLAAGPSPSRVRWRGNWFNG